MGGLGHYLEAQGIPTTQISLIRVHSEKIKPPRALWVTFELGRPLGAPSDAAFQRRVIIAALKLLDEPAGPVLRDFPHHAPKSTEEDQTWACPLPHEEPPAVDGPSGLATAFINEAAQLTSWYTRAVKNRGRTTYGASGLQPHEAARLLTGLLTDDDPPSPRPEIKLVWLAKLAAEDIKAYYLEAATAQPGNQDQDPGCQALMDWFFQKTAAGKLFYTLRRKLAVSEDSEWKLLGTLLMVPMSQLGKK